MKERVAITGLGAISGFGEGVERLWRALKGGARAMQRSEGLAARGLEVGPVSLVPGLSLDTHARATKMAEIAAREALTDAGMYGPDARVALVQGTTLGGIESWLRVVRDETQDAERFSYAGLAHAVADSLRLSGPISVVSIACASGNAAIGSAMDLLREHRAEVVLAGGADAIHDFVVSGFASLKALSAEPCRPFDRARRGLNLGEGAAFLALETESHARARDARVYAYLDGFGLAGDAVHMTGPDREGRGAARAMRAAMKAAGVNAEQIGFVSAHGTATPFNDLMEGKAIPLALGRHGNLVPVNSIKGSLGHTLGAAGAFEAILCALSLRDQLVTPTAGLEEIDADIPLRIARGAAMPTAMSHALSTSSGFGGTNAALIFSRAEATR